MKLHIKGQKLLIVVLFSAIISTPVLFSQGKLYTTDSTMKIISQSNIAIGDSYKLLVWPEKYNMKESIDTLEAVYKDTIRKVVRHISNYYKSKIQVFNENFFLLEESAFDSLGVIRSIEKNLHGNVLFILNDNNGIRTTAEFFEGGTPMNIWVFDEKNNHIISQTDFDSSGRVNQIMQYLEKDTLIQWISYYSGSGIKSHESYMGNKVMPWYAYFPDGSISIEAKTYGNLPNNYVGKLKAFYPNGSLMREEIYDEKIPKFRIGTWSWWDENGNLLKREIYKDNVLVETKEFLPEVKMKEK